MRTIWIIARREAAAFFDSLAAYILLVAFLGFTGFFTWLYGQDIFFIRQATLMPFFSWASILLTIFVPAITMRMIAEERKTGTLEFLLTRSVSDWQLVAGKYLGSMLLVGAALALTLPYYLSVSLLGKTDHGATLCGYLGLLLLSSALTAVGIFASSLSANQIVAFLIALISNLFCMLLFGLLAQAVPGSSLAGQLLHLLDFTGHFESLSRGVIDSRDVVFFLSITLLGLVLAEARLAQRNLADA
ncbi:MAG: ABC transporter permease subunit [Bacteroidia bacterium]|nr:ABC transporter permease subunit [Bacteroidia bacterium]